jgi:hypothetical protein
METENEARFRNCARMGRHSFELLLRRCKAEGQLKDSKKITAGEKLMIFLYVLSGKSNRDTQERWQHSGDSISKVVHQVASAILQLRLLVKPDVDETAEFILRSPKYYPFFKHCIGALDGTHIPAVVPSNIRDSFINRKGYHLRTFSLL